MKIADFLVHLSLCPCPVWARLSPVLSAPALWVKVGDVPSRAEGAPRVPALSLLAPRGCTEPLGEGHGCRPLCSSHREVRRRLPSKS